MRSPQSAPSQRASAIIESTYSCSSFSGLVSSKRRLVLPPNSAASPKFRQMDFAWPRWRYPLGSGGNRVCTRPLYLLVLRSSRMMSRTKFDGRAEDSDASCRAESATSRFEVAMNPLYLRVKNDAGEPNSPSSLFYVVGSRFAAD